MIDTGITPTVYDRVLTLSTCTGNGHATRWVVQAVLKGVAPPDTAQEVPAEPTSEGPAPEEQPASQPLPETEPGQPDQAAEEPDAPE